MKLSVIIPVHNRAEVVKQAVNSVLEQLDHESELILVDDGSSPAVSHEFNDKRLKIIRLDQNQGASNARNVGVEHANGDWISFLDSDDLWLKGRFNQIKNVIEQNKHNLNSQDLKVWITAVVRKKGGGYLYHCVTEQAHTYPHHFGGCRTCPGSSMLLQKQTFMKIGLFDTQLGRLEDYDWFLRFFAQNGVINQHETATVLIETAGGGTLSKVVPAVTRIRQKLQTPNRRTKAYLALELARASLYDKKYLLVCWYLLTSFAHVPRLDQQMQKVTSKPYDKPQ